MKRLLIHRRQPVCLTSVFAQFSSAHYHSRAGKSNQSSMTNAISLSKDVHHLKLSPKSDGAINLKLVQAHIKSIERKFKLNIDNYESNLAQKHPSSQRKHKHADTTAEEEGDVALTDQKDELWTGTISYGGQPINIDFDTGSTDTLVNAGAYVPGDGAKKTSKTFKARYGDGTTAEGTVYTDTMEIGGLAPVPDVAIGLATTTFLKTESGSQGISGLAYPSLSHFGKEYPPFFDCLLSAKAVARPLFSFALSSEPGQSELVLGNVSAKAAGPATYVDVDRSVGFWQCAPGSCSVNGIKITAIIDSGTTLIVGSPTQVAQLLDSLPGVSKEVYDGVTYGFLTTSAIPQIAFKLGDKNIILTEEATTYGTDQNGRKMLSIVGRDIGVEGWIVGDPLFRSSVIVFDRGNDTIGFADRLE